MEGEGIQKDSYQLSAFSAQLNKEKNCLSLKADG